MINIRRLEAELWESADLLRADSNLTSQQYCMPVLGLIFLRYADIRFKRVETELLKNRPLRKGVPMPVEASDFKSKSALFLPLDARYDYLLNLPDNADMGKALNNAMELIEKESNQLKGILPKEYPSFKNELLHELLRIFNNSAFREIQDDLLGRIYEYFLNKFAPAVASTDGVFFTPKSLVRMIVNIIEPKHGTLFDPACGSGGMFVSSSDFINNEGTDNKSPPTQKAITEMTFYGQEKVEYNAKLCLMNMSVHGLNAKIKSGDDANSFYTDAFSLNGKCDFVMANPPFNVDKVKSETAGNAGRLPFGLPSINDSKEISNANYLWISYFYSYLNDSGRAGFVMASSATDSSGKERLIREQLIKTGHVDVILSVGNNFFYTKSLPCTLWFFDKGKNKKLLNKILFIDARNYSTAVDRTLNEWSTWQMRNLNTIVHLYRGQTKKYKILITDYEVAIINSINDMEHNFEALKILLGTYNKSFVKQYEKIKKTVSINSVRLEKLYPISNELHILTETLNNTFKEWIAYGESLDKEGRKTFAKKIDPNAPTYEKLKKSLQIKIEIFITEVNSCRTIISEARWLTDKFNDGVYADVNGLCRLADIADIEEKNWSLTPGAYVGVTEEEKIDDNFNERMREIHSCLRTLHGEANKLMKTIENNFIEMGL